MNKNRYRCPECRTRITDKRLFHLHCMKCPRSTCDCGGYHYKHRPGSPCCELNPKGMLHAAARAGATDEQLEDLAVDLAFDTPGKSGNDCPF